MNIDDARLNAQRNNYVNIHSHNIDDIRIINGSNKLH